MTNANINAMNPEDVKLVVEKMYHARKPVMVWGSPGIGKTSVFEQVAKSLKVDLLNIKLSMRSPLDFQVPVTQPDGSVKFITPSLLPRKGKGIMFLDELDKAPKEVQKLGLELVLERRIGEYKVPDGWSVFAAGNRLKDMTGSEGMISALAARFIHLDMEVDNDQWCMWAIERDVHPAVIAFIRMNPSYLNAFNPKERVSPNPRAWAEYVSEIVQADFPRPVMLSAIAGTVGAAHAAEFVAFMSVYEQLPSVSQIMKQPKKADLVNNLSALYAITSVLTRTVVKHQDAGMFSSMVQYLKRGDVHKEEMLAMAVSSVESQAKKGGWFEDVAATAEYREWALHDFAASV